MHPPIPSPPELSGPSAAAVAPEPRSLGPRRHRQTGATTGLRRRLGRAALAAAAAGGLLFVVAGLSLASALRAPGNLSATEKSVEWLRDHHMGPVVNSVENWWFSHNAPNTGGEPGRQIAVGAPPTSSATTRSTDASRPHTPRPADIATPAGSALPNEGVWQAVGPQVGGLSAMYATQIRPDAVHTSLLEGIVWMDPKLLRFDVHPGLQEPGGSWATPPSVPPDQRLDLVAAFNGGFRMQDANGGFYLEGREQNPLRAGAASFVVSRDGSATVGEWGRDISMNPDVVAVRQNLRLIVDNGAPVAGLDNNTNGAWGATLGNRVLVWRSAVCVDANGGIIYGYGGGLGALSLAEMMQRAGCVRAMELDINPSWTTFNLYSAQGAGDPSSVAGSKMLPEQTKSGDRYLTNDARDFVAVFRRPS